LKAPGADEFHCPFFYLLLTINMNIKIDQKITNAIRQLLILYALYIVYIKTHEFTIKIPTCQTDSRACADKKQAMTSRIIIKQILIATVVALGVWNTLSLIGVNPSTLIASTGISIAIIGLSIKPVLDEYIQGSVLIFQKRVTLGDDVHILTRFGRWIPEINEGPVKVIDLTPSFFTFRSNSGAAFTMNTTQISGFKIINQAGTDMQTHRHHKDVLLDNERATNACTNRLQLATDQTTIHTDPAQPDIDIDTSSETEALLNLFI
jgi:hypothetical protein